MLDCQFQAHCHVSAPASTSILQRASSPPVVAAHCTAAVHLRVLLFHPLLAASTQAAAAKHLPGYSRPPCTHVHAMQLRDTGAEQMHGGVGG